MIALLVRVVDPRRVIVNTKLLPRSVKNMMKRYYEFIKRYTVRDFQFLVHFTVSHGVLVHEKLKIFLFKLKLRLYKTIL